MAQTDEYFELVTNYPVMEGNVCLLLLSKGDIVKLIKKEFDFFTVEKDGQMLKVPKGKLCACSLPPQIINSIHENFTSLTNTTIPDSQSQKTELSISQISKSQSIEQKEAKGDSTNYSFNQQQFTETITQLPPFISSRISETTTNEEKLTEETSENITNSQELSKHEKQENASQTVDIYSQDSVRFFEVVADCVGKEGNTNLLPVQKGEIICKSKKENKQYAIVIREIQIPQEYLRECPFPFSSSKLNAHNPHSQLIAQQNLLKSKQLVNNLTLNIKLSDTHDGEDHQINSDQELAVSSMSVEELQEKIEQLQYNDFELIRELSSGAFGRVIVVKYKFADIIIAIKRVPYKSSDKIKLADQEISMLKKAQSRYTVRFIGKFKYDLDLCMLQEFCIGGNLRGQLEKMQSMPIEERMEIVSGLQVLHSNNIAHRDLKPENILIDKDGNAKLADFGLAEMIESKSYLKTAGTFNYAPPESFSQNRMMIESDIWAVGVIVTELVAGVHPFTGRNQEEISTKIRDGKFAPLPDHVQGEMKKMIVKMLSVDITKRPTVEDLLATEIMKHQAQIEKVATDEKIAERLVCGMVLNNREIERQKEIERKKIEEESEKTLKIQNDNKNLQQQINRSERLQIGKVKFENYKKIEKLGSGGFGEVYKIKRKSDNKFFVYQEIYCRNIEEENKLINKTKILQKLHHKHLVEFIEAFQHENNIYIVNEIYENGSLREFYMMKKEKGESISEEQAWNFLIQMTLVVKYLHSKGILHKNLKQRFILLASDGTIRVSGFNFSKYLDSQQDTDSNNPENKIHLSQFPTSSIKYNFSSDIYDVGQVMIEILTQQPPYIQRTGKQKSPIILHCYSSELIELINSLRTANPNYRPSTEQILAHPHILKIIQEMNLVHVTPMLVWDIDLDLGFIEKEQDSLLVVQNNTENKIHSIKLVVPDISDKNTTMGLDPIFRPFPDKQQFIRIIARFFDQPQGVFRRIGIVDTITDVANDSELGMDENSIAYDGTSGQIIHGGQIVCTNDKFENDDIVQLEVFLPPTDKLNENSATLSFAVNEKQQKNVIIKIPQVFRFCVQLFYSKSSIEILKVEISDESTLTIQSDHQTLTW